jgi:hypothetical protein
VIESPASKTTFWSPPTTANAPPGRIIASLTKNAEEPPLLLTFAETVWLIDVVLANERPMIVAVLPELTVGVTVDGLPDVPMLADTDDLNAMSYPSAIAIAIASFVASSFEKTSMLVRAVAVFVRSLRLFPFSALSLFKLEKLLSTSVFVRGDPLVDRIVIVDIRSPSYRWIKKLPA